jgi:hypothetical protein
VLHWGRRITVIRLAKVIKNLNSQQTADGHYYNNMHTMKLQHSKIMHMHTHICKLSKKGKITLTSKPNDALSLKVTFLAFSATGNRLH